MAELKGVTGKIARVDLSSGEVSVVEPPEEIYKKFLGGWGWESTICSRKESLSRT